MGCLPPAGASVAGGLSPPRHAATVGEESLSIRLRHAPPVAAASRRAWRSAPEERSCGASIILDLFQELN